jgi:predicted trehalose synthase
MDWLEHKIFVLHLNGERLSLQAVAPMNADEHDELRRLEEKGLRKFLVMDSSSSYLFDKSVVQKLIRNLLAIDNPDFEIVDRSESSRRILRIKASNISVRDAVIF